MCGIAGELGSADPVAFHIRENAIRHMTRAVTHRGPDDCGLYIDTEIDIALGHRRLSVIDLSPSGHQPMMSTTGRYVVSYNGELYNFKTLRDELRGIGHRIHGESDTAVLLAAVEQWGVSSALCKFSGMFAFAIWDRVDRVLWLARDRFGEKPLYYSLQDGRVRFASELRGIMTEPSFRTSVAIQNIPSYLRHSCYPDNTTAIEDTLRLRPGHYARIDWKNLKALDWSRVEDIPTRAYWSAANVYAEKRAEPFSGTMRDAADELEKRLTSVVAGQMVSDVPLGAFLSGGIDSSLVVAIMSRLSKRKVRTFTIGYREKSYSEAGYARRIAEHLGTEHVNFEATSESALEVIRNIGSIYDEPFADSSQVPTILVSRLARAEVTVALTGDGGDEIFGGYNRHVWSGPIWRCLSAVPLSVRKGMAFPMSWLGPRVWDAVGTGAQRAHFRPLAHVGLGLKVQKLREILASSNEVDFYRRLTGTWNELADLVPGATSLPEPRAFPGVSGSTADRQMLWDTISYLPDDILTKVDRASMSVGLETRCPYLDHSLAEWSWSLPADLKIKHMRGKLVLRELLARYVPAELFERPKQGFGVPIGDWLRGQLRDWADSLLDPARLRSEGIFNPTPIRRLWEQHQSGTADRSAQLWSVIVFQNWQQSIINRVG